MTTHPAPPTIVRWGKLRIGGIVSAHPDPAVVAELGPIVMGAQYLEEFVRQEIRFCPTTRQVVEDLGLAQERQEFDLHLASPRAFGFGDRAWRHEVFECAAERGLLPCPAEVGPAFRLTLKGQGRGRVFVVASEPAKDRDGRPWMFALGHASDGPWIGVRPDGPLPPDDVMVWCAAR